MYIIVEIQNAMNIMPQIQCDQRHLVVFDKKGTLLIKDVKCLGKDQPKVLLISVAIPLPSGVVSARMSGIVARSTVILRSVDAPNPGGFLCLMVF
jgi:hypothetical protein